MRLENTELERRVLAHERILQALMAQLEKAEPGFLNAMSAQFAGSQRGAHQHDYIETADYAEAFMREVMHVADASASRAEKRGSVPLRSFDPAAAAGRVQIRVTRGGGVWHVTKDGSFLGDYLAADPAFDAANMAADEVEALGGVAELTFER